MNDELERLAKLIAAKSLIEADMTSITGRPALISHTGWSSAACVVRWHKLCPIHLPANLAESQKELTMPATPLTIHRAYLALPHLIEAAKAGHIITYTELGNKIGCHPHALMWPLGYIRDSICARHHVPPLNALVVNKQTTRPGTGSCPSAKNRCRTIKKSRSLRSSLLKSSNTANGTSFRRMC